MSIKNTLYKCLEIGFTIILVIALAFMVLIGYTLITMVKNAPPPLIKPIESVTLANSELLKEKD